MPGSTTAPGRADTRNSVPVRVAFRQQYGVGARNDVDFAAQWLAYAIPCRRFAEVLADNCARLGTSHGLSSAFLASQAGIERRSLFEHGAGDVEKTVADSAQCTGMAATASLQSKILSFALLITPPGGVSQVVYGIPQSWIAGEPSVDGAAFA